MTGQLNIRTGSGGQGLSIGDSRGQGIIYITGYDKTNYCALFNDSSNSFTETRHLYLPNKTGTLALTSDLESRLLDTGSNSGSNHVIATITCSDSGAYIEDFTTIFKNYRNPILCWYTTQGASISLAVVYYNNSSVSIAKIHGEDTTVSISSTSSRLLLPGWNNWGNGIAIGIKAT